MKKAQGALEYLLLIGGAIVVAIVVIAIIVAITSSSEEETIVSTANALCSKLPPDECNAYTFRVGDAEFSCYLTENKCRARGGMGITGLAVYLNMDDAAQGPGDTVPDVTGNGNDGIFYGRNENSPNNYCTVPGRPGGGKGCEFDGSDRDNISITYPYGTGPSDGLTIAAWVKTDSVDTRGGTILSRGDNYGLHITNTGEVRFFKSIGVDQASGDSVWYSLETDFDDGVGVLTGEWTHIAAVQDLGEMKIYVNCDLKASESGTPPIIYDQLEGIRIGRDGFNHWGAYDFHGIMDDVAIWNTAMDITAIRDFAQACPPP